MNVNKKLDRLRHWAGEKMGGEVKTNTSDEFKALEVEMQLRAEGLERMHKTMTIYVKSLSKRNEADDKEKMTAIAQLASTALNHAEDFEPESDFGQCLSRFGQTNDRIARLQDKYAAAATTSWLDGLERSLAQMKEYQASRKKLESRRLAFDTSQTKMQKSKKDDFRMEEDLRSHRAKYEESSEDVYRRMLDIKEAEVDSVADLTAFLDAELDYHDRAREMLLQLRQDWPVASELNPHSGQRRVPRSRTSTMSSSAQRHPDEASPVDSLPTRSRIVSAQNPGASSPMRERPGFDFTSSMPGARPALSRHSTASGAIGITGSLERERRGSGFEGPRSLAPSTRDVSPATSLPRLSRVPTDTSIASMRSGLRPIRTNTNQGTFLSPTSASNEAENVFADGDDESPVSHEQQRHGAQRDSALDFTSGSSLGGSKKMGPPPPPPSRSKKPPPPPPLKRSALSTGDVPRM